MQVGTIFSLSLKCDKGSRPKKNHKTADFFRTPLSPPPASTDTYGGLFSKSAYRRLATFGEKSAYATILGGTYPFH